MLIMAINEPGTFLQYINQPFLPLQYKCEFIDHLLLCFQTVECFHTLSHDLIHNFGKTVNQILFIFQNEWRKEKERKKYKKQRLKEKGWKERREVKNIYRKKMEKIIICCKSSDICTCKLE